jgi:NADPH:quinone reductase-like Zn-dependent oxidoreductase
VVGSGLFEVFQALLLAPLLSRISRKKTCFFIAKINQKDLTFLKKFLETGKMISVIDKRFPLQNTADAMRYLEEKHAQGKVVISVIEGNQT